MKRRLVLVSVLAGSAGWSWWAPRRWPPRATGLPTSSSPATISPASPSATTSPCRRSSPPTARAGPTSSTRGRCWSIPNANAPIWIDSPTELANGEQPQSRSRATPPASRAPSRCGCATAGATSSPPSTPTGGSMGVVAPFTATLTFSVPYNAVGQRGGLRQQRRHRRRGVQHRRSRYPCPRGGARARSTAPTSSSAVRRYTHRPALRHQLAHHRQPQRPVQSEPDLRWPAAAHPIAVAGRRANRGAPDCPHACREAAADCSRLSSSSGTSAPHRSTSRL